MERIKTIIQTNRPNLGESSVRTYVSILKSLFYKAHTRENPVDIEWFKNQDDILELLKDVKPLTRKTTLASLVVLNGAEDSDKFQSQMMLDNEASKIESMKQSKSEKQEENWMDYEDVKGKWFSIYSRVKPILNGKDNLSIDDFKALNTFMLVSLTTGVFFPPRRSLEWVELKISGEIDKEKNNYINMKESQFVLNRHKNSNRQTEADVLSFPKEFKTILSKYIKRVGHKTEYLISDYKGRPLNSTKITARLNDFFGKRISTSMLRHIYESHIYRDVPALTELLQTAKDMGHGGTDGKALLQHLEYIKY